MYLVHLLDTASKVLDVVSYTFSPRTGATSREVRINGALSIVVGCAVLLACVPVLLLVDPKWSARIVAAPALCVYALWLFGGFRVVFGASPTQKPTLLLSIVRIAFGITFIIAMAGLLIGVAWVAQKLLRGA